MVWRWISCGSNTGIKYWAIPRSHMRPIGVTVTPVGHTWLTGIAQCLIPVLEPQLIYLQTISCSYKPDCRLPVLSASTVTFRDMEHQHPLTSIKLYCLMTDVCGQLSPSHYMSDKSWTWRCGTASDLRSRSCGFEFWPGSMRKNSGQVSACHQAV